MSLERLNPIPDSLYDAVEAMPGAGLYHRKAWHSVLSEALGWQVEAFVARHGDGGVRFFLPFVEKRSMTLARTRVALPLSHLVRPLGTLEPGEDAALTGLFVHAPVEGGAPDLSRTITRLHVDAGAVSDTVFKGFGSGIQRDYKRALKAGYTITDTRAADDIEAFSRLQAETRRRQGSPTFPARFFAVMARHLGEDFHLHLVRTPQGQPAAGIIMIDDGDTSLYAYGASRDDRELWQAGVNQLSLGSAILSAVDRGRTIIDFGTTPKLLDGLKAYKERWGGVSEDLPYTRIGAAASGQPERDSPLVRLSSEVLKRMPLPLFRAISPALLKLAA